MNKQESKYEVSLTYLEKFQTAKKYRYSLARCASENQYSISVSEWENETMRQEFTKDFVTDSAQAHNVVQWLCQNVVAPVHLCDVLHNLKVQGHIAMQE